MSVPTNMEVLNYTPEDPLYQEVLQKQHFFDHKNVAQFSEADFDMESQYKIGLRYKDNFFVLFYMENKESIELCKVFASVASYQGPVNFAAVNLKREKKVLDSFASLTRDMNHPFFPFALQRIPFLIVYRGGWPKAFYNGPRNTQAMVDYCYTRAPRPDYIEMIQKTASAQVDNGLSMPGVKYYDINTKRDSTQFLGSTRDAITQFDELPVEEMGSTGEARALAARREIADIEDQNEIYDNLKKLNGDNVKIDV